MSEARQFVGPDGNPIFGRKRSSVIDWQGYANAAASLTDPSLKSWSTPPGSPLDDIDSNVPLIRQRTRDLYYNTPIVAGAVNLVVANVVGRGLKPIPTPDTERLGWSNQQAADWKSRLLEEWEEFASSENCDVERRNNFYELTQLLLRSQIISGDVFVSLPMIPRVDVAYDLRIQIIESDRVCNPEDDTALLYAMPGATVYEGIEVGEWGNVLAVYVCTSFPTEKKQLTPANPNSDFGAMRRWVRIPITGDLTGRRNILHIMTSQRPGQRRGVSLLAPVIKPVKILDRYIGAELQAALIQSLFNVFIQSEAPTLMAGEMGNIIPEAQVDPMEIALGPGIMHLLNPGESVNPVQPTHPAATFSDFVSYLLRIIGAAIGVPYELLMQSFTSSYSASRASLNMAQIGFESQRDALVHDFCNPVWRAFMDELAASGRLEMPGYFDDTHLQSAYLRCSWQGPGYPMIDPTKDVQAAKEMISSGFSTHERETARLTGGDWYMNAIQLGKELEVMQQTGMNVFLKSPSQRAEEGGTGGANSDQTDDLGQKP